MKEAFFRSRERFADKFLQSPPLQPKREIADYLESQGILVPRRYDSLSEAMQVVRSGGEIMVRSEHPDEYSGAAGLLSSYRISKYGLGKPKNRDEFSVVDDIAYKTIRTFSGDLDQEELEKSLVKLARPKIAEYCGLMKLNPDDFEENISYSYWEKLGGMSRTIIADSAIQGRYHIFSGISKPDSFFYNYSIIDNGQILINEFRQMSREMRWQIGEVISFYQRIRNTKGFDPNHCPLVEFQTENGKNYFLQYHRTRRFERSRWKLTRGPEKGEIEATFVRGATGKKGKIFNVVQNDPDSEYLEIPDEEGSINSAQHPIFLEVMSRRWLVNISFAGDEHQLAQKCSHEPHLRKSKMFNPQLSIFLPDEDFPEELGKRMRLLNMARGEPTTTTRIRVISDGRRAYVKFLDA